jgi:hypothetical protein
MPDRTVLFIKSMADIVFERLYPESFRDISESRKNIGTRTSENNKSAIRCEIYELSVLALIFINFAVNKVAKYLLYQQIKTHS